jgi:hypothetical protein
VILHVKWVEIVSSSELIRQFEMIRLNVDSIVYFDLAIFAFLVYHIKGKGIIHLAEIDLTRLCDLVGGYLYLANQV